MRLAQIACLILIAACLTGAGSASAEEGRFLKALRGEVDEPAAPESSNDSDRDHHDKPRHGKKRGGSSDGCRDGEDEPSWSLHFGTSHDDECHDSGDLGAWVIFYGVTSPWWIPNGILENAEETLAGFPVAPYVNGHDGYLVFASEEVETAEVKTGTWGGRISLDTGDNFDDVTTTTGRLRIDSVSRFGLDAEWGHLAERHRGGFDWLGRGDCNLVVRFAQSSRVQFHSGIGINWLADPHNADVGFNFTYGVDVFPVDPVVTSATLDLGRIGDANLIHFRGTVGAMVTPRLHLYTGYDLLNLEGNSIHSFLTGIEFWF